MAFGSWGFGHYSMTFTPALQSIADCGLIEGPRTWTVTPEGEDIITDQYGDAVVDTIYRGQNAFLQVTFKEWTDVVRRIINPYSLGTFDQGNWGPIGASANELAGIVVLTPTPNTPAVANGPQLWTANKAIPVAGTAMDIPMGNVERNVPVTFRLLPYTLDAGMTWRNFHVTQA